jgi:hypothetical protein
MKMLPCPFCGCKKSRTSRYDGDTWRICNDCGAATAPSTTISEANRRWNVRPTNTADADVPTLLTLINGLRNMPMRTKRFARQIGRIEKAAEQARASKNGGGL